MDQSRARDALSGGLAAALALGASEFLAGLVSGIPSLVEGLGNFVIDNVPKPVKDFAIEVFGTNDKLALLIGIALVTVLIGAIVGIYARRSFAVAIAVFIGFAAVATLATAQDFSPAM